MGLKKSVYARKISDLSDSLFRYKRKNPSHVKIDCVKHFNIDFNSKVRIQEMQKILSRPLFELLG